MHGCEIRENLYCDICEVYPSLQRAVGCIDPKPLEEPLAQYGIGVVLYFKYLKMLIHVFAAYSLIAIPTIYYNWEASTSKYRYERIHPI